MMSMNEQVACALIDTELRRLQDLSYSELAALVGKVETKELVGEDGKTYQLEIQAFWDSKKGADVRLIVAADDGGRTRKWRQPGAALTRPAAHACSTTPRRTRPARCLLIRYYERQTSIALPPIPYVV
jgi:hypothetical protein